MNENIDLTKILKNCPEGTIFWSDNYGEVKFKCIAKSYKYTLKYPILVERTDGTNAAYTKEGWCDIYFPANCLLWPSKNSRDWSKFSAPWYKKERFDPKTLKEFDRILGWNPGTCKWECNLFSNINDYAEFNFKCFGVNYKYCIPYNDDTKHLVGTKEEAPEYYRYWED